MTIVGRRVSPGTRRARYGEAEVQIALDNVTSQLLALADDDNDDGVATLCVNREWFEGRFVVKCRSDVQETQIYICSPEVLSLFQDNFDWEHLRKDFVQGMLIEGAELGKNLHVTLLEDLQPVPDTPAVPKPPTHYYACRAHNLRAYAAMARDVMKRYACEPISVDRNLFHPVAGTAQLGWDVTDGVPSTYRRVRVRGPRMDSS